MRNSVLAVAVTIGVVAILVVWLRLRSQTPESGSRSDPNVEQAPGPGDLSRETAAESSPLEPPLVVAEAVSTNLGPEQMTAEALAQKIEQVEALAELNNPGDLAALIAELRHPVRAVRAAAVRAAVQMGDRQVAPALRQLATNTVDTAEKIQATEAAEFLELPTLREWRHQRRQPATGASNSLGLSPKTISP